MTQWEGKAKGTPLGYKIFIFFIKNLGLNAAYSILIFVAAYYLVFSYTTTKTSYYFYRKRLKQSFFKTILSIYKNYFVFGQTLIDRTAISFGLKDKFTFSHDGREKMQRILDEGKGGIIFSAHVGSFNIARYFFDDFDMTNTGVNLMVTDQENEQIKEYVGAVSSGTAMKCIVIKDDMSHIFQMNDAIANGEVIIFAADRYVEGIQFLEHDFLDKPVKFPSGPYKLAARKKKPILFMYIMKGSGKRYNLYAREPEFTESSIKPSHVLREYVRNTEIMVKKYPLQWFNYFDYWGDLKT
ncbi:LpxL/LpxP family acyltransferase [Aquimarina sp. 2201CG14-23]|uniref:LpxL/LpxP family acyltransferase n=1 Tax=Aquimarina mycalae TaxID=3040073 RepID=UPI002477D689|nr:lipid A biosynthesis acyltransferase [Aquimarina sp. 2201CG14-23]MDH7446750.1 lipid A biosynthesis acyltransferase [Aquimarina sp. 2201CG14-23]